MCFEQSNESHIISENTIIVHFPFISISVSSEEVISTEKEKKLLQSNLSERQPFKSDNLSLTTMLWSSFRFLGQTSLYIATTSTMRPATTLMMSKAFYYFHIMTTAQSAYSRSYNKFSRYFCFKVIFNMLFYHNIVFCFQQKYMLICFCFLCFSVSKKSVSIMCD